MNTMLRPGFHSTANSTTTTQKQSDYKVEQSSFALIVLFWLKISCCRGRNWLNGNQALWIFSNEYIYRWGSCGSIELNSECKQSLEQQFDYLFKCAGVKLISCWDLTEQHIIILLMTARQRPSPFFSKSFGTFTLVLSHFWNSTEENMRTLSCRLRIQPSNKTMAFSRSASSQVSLNVIMLLSRCLLLHGKCKYEVKMLLPWNKILWSTARFNFVTLLHKPDVPSSTNTINCYCKQKSRQILVGPQPPPTWRTLIFIVKLVTWLNTIEKTTDTFNQLTVGFTELTQLTGSTDDWQFSHPL